MYEFNLIEAKTLNSAHDQIIIDKYDYHGHFVGNVTYKIIYVQFYSILYCFSQSSRKKAVWPKIWL